MKTRASDLLKLAFAAMALTGLANCASNTPKEQSEPSSETTITYSKPVAEQVQDSMGIELKSGLVKAEAHAAAVAKSGSETMAAPAHTPAKVTAHQETPMGVEPSKALGWLKNGNTRFIKGRLRNDGQSKADILRLAKGQKPHTIVLSCSDSRVPPEIVFDQKLGEIFVVRTAGETLEPTSIASIEYAVEHLGTRLILVMGHSSCGAVKAAHSTLGGADAGSPNLNKLVADIHPRIKQFAGKTPSEGYQKESWANAKGVAKDLLSRSTLLTNKIKSGDVQIQTALYQLESGRVDFE